MRISDWSSDVCSSDLLDDPRVGGSDPRAGKGLGTTIGYAIGSREPEAAAAEHEPGDDLEPGVRATERELLEHIEADAPELADAIAPPNRALLVEHEHQVDEAIPASCREIGMVHGRVAR